MDLALLREAGDRDPGPGGVHFAEQPDQWLDRLGAGSVRNPLPAGYELAAQDGDQDRACRRLVGGDMFLDEPSVTGTENAVMAAALAKGTTRIRNAAAEPHVQDLCNMLVGMGCQIDGIGSGTLVIQGADRLKGGRFRITSDHIEIGSFIGLAAVTRSELTIADAAVEHLDSTLIGL